MIIYVMICKDKIKNIKMRILLIIFFGEMKKVEQIPLSVIDSSIFRLRFGGCVKSFRNGYRMFGK